MCASHTLHKQLRTGGKEIVLKQCKTYSKYEPPIQRDFEMHRFITGDMHGILEMEGYSSRRGKCFQAREVK